MQGSVPARLLAPASTSAGQHLSRRTRACSARRSPLPALCLASRANGAPAVNASANGGGAAKLSSAAGLDLEEFSVRDQRGLCLSPLGQEAVMKEITRQTASANRQPQKPYTVDDWDRHKSSDRYIRHLGGIFTNPQKSLLVPTFLSALAVSAAGVYSTYLVKMYALPAIIKAGFPSLGVITGCLSFLLVFRTNNSYSRFDEARKLWGSLVNRGRDIVRQSNIYFPRSPEGRASAKALARWVNAHNQCLRAFCDPKQAGDVMPMMREWLHPKEYEMLEKAAHRPGFCMQMIGELIHLNIADKDEALRMDENVRMFEDVVGACERIFRTPIPVGYTRHTSRFLSAWAAIVPIVMWNEFQWAALVVAPVLTWLLYSVEEIGVQLEEPFSMLPLAQICETIRTNTQEIAQRFGEDCRPLADALYGRPKNGGAHMGAVAGFVAAA